ncbi:unnamed protein product, partial [Ascophyllum nodosum]
MGMAMATRPSGPEGVEWAGWECKFSGVDGKRTAVPEDYVPESLREWDVEVWGFETLTSEQLRRQKPDEIGLLYRKRARVFPEVGCALDNLSLEVIVQTLSLDDEGIFFGAFPGGSYVMGKKPASSQCLRMEAGLVVSGRDFGDAHPLQETDEGGAGEQSRIRVEYQVEPKGNEGQGELAGCLGATVTVTRERRYRAAFDDGLLYKGGGLDAQKLRGLLCSDCFSEKEDAPVAAALAGEWRCDPGMWSDLRNSMDKGTPQQDLPDDTPPRLMLLERSETFWESRSDAAGGGIECLLMRGGLTLRSGPWRGDSDSDGQSWGGAAAADSRVRPSGLGGSSDVGKAMWAVEVG